MSLIEVGTRFVVRDSGAVTRAEQRYGRLSGCEGEVTFAPEGDRLVSFVIHRWTERLPEVRACVARDQFGMYFTIRSIRTGVSRALVLHEQERWPNVFAVPPW